MKSIFQKINPHLISILGFIAIIFLLYRPQFTENKTLSQHDILQGVGTNHQIREYYEETGEVPLWNNYIFSGMPTYLDGIIFKGDLLKTVQRISNIGIPRPAHITFRLFLGFYFMLIMFGVRPWIAFAGALTFGMNGFNIISIMAGHNMKIDAVSYIPLVIGAVHYTLYKKKILGAVLLSLFMALQIHTGHYQMTYYLLLIVLVYGVVNMIWAFKNNESNNFFLKVGIMVIAVIFSIAANTGKIWTTLEYSKYSTRGPSDLVSTSSEESSGLDKSYAFQYSNGIMEPFFLFIPNILGGASNQSLDEDSNLGLALRRAGMSRQQIQQQLTSVPTYWGDQPLSAPYYAGMVSVFLFVLSMFFLDKRLKYFAIAIVALGILLSYGDNFAAFNYLMFDYFPGYNKFRSVTFAIIISLTGISLAGFVGLEKVIQQKPSAESVKKLFMAIGITGGFALFILIIANFLSYSGAIDSRLPEVYLNALLKDRKSLLTADAFRALIFVLIAGSLIWAYIKEKLNKNVAIGVFILVVFVDMFTLTNRYFKDSLFEKATPQTKLQASPADQVILQNTSSGERVLNLQNPWNETRTAYHHESLGGYHGAKMQRYQELIEYQLQKDMQYAINQLQSGSTDLSGANGLNMLNTRYFFAGSAQNAAIPNNNAFGNAWSVQNVKLVNNANEEIEAVGNTNLKQTAIIDQSKFNIAETTYRPATIELKEKTPNKITYSSRSNGNSLVVFSEIYYPEGWVAKIDGKESPIFRANYVLRALEIPSGNHEIEFAFAPSSYMIGDKITLVFNILLILLVLFIVGREARFALKGQ